VPHVKLATANYLSVPPAGEADNSQINLKRSGSERLRDGAKNILRRVESIKSRRKKRKNREGVVISGPMHLDIMQIHHKFQDLKCKDIKTTRSNTTSPLPMSPVGATPLFLFADTKVCPTDSGMASSFGQRLTPHINPASRTSPLHFFSPKKTTAAAADDSTSCCSEVSIESSSSAERKPSLAKQFFQMNPNRDDDMDVLSDTEALATRQQKKKSNSNSSSSGKKPNVALIRGSGAGGSFNLGRESNRHRESFKTRRIFRSRSAVRHTPTTSLDDNSSSQDVVALRADAKSGSVVRWHSFRAQTTTKHDFAADGEGVSLCKLSCGQIEKLRKLALVTLTGYMERLVFRRHQFDSINSTFSYLAAYVGIAQRIEPAGIGSCLSLLRKLRRPITKVRWHCFVIYGRLEVNSIFSRIAHR